MTAPDVKGCDRPPITESKRLFNRDEVLKGDLEKQARQTYEKVLSTYKSAGFVRDTFQDLIAIKEAVGRSKFVDECLALFRENWHPESL